MAWLSPRGGATVCLNVHRMTLDCPTCAGPVDDGAGVCLACGRCQPILALGSVFATRYELRALLGEGGLGVVYRALDRNSDEEVALKVLRTDLVSNAQAASRLRTEIERARQVSHPNVCRILDHGEVGPLGYLSMEVLDGEDLQKTLKKKSQGLPEAEALSAVLQIASGLQAIHDAGILHGDLKTAHAVRDEGGVVRIVPFGMVKDLLSTGEAMGAPEYMSPEQCWGYPLDFRSDVYALGIVAFEVFAGDVPLRGANLTDTTFKQMREAASFDNDLGSRVPRRFVPALSRALAKAAPDRFASALEFAQALRSVAPDAPAIASLGEAPRIPAAALAPPMPPAPPAPTPHAPAASAAATPTSRQTTEDARRDERFELPTDVLLRKLGPSGASEKEERTIAHDLSRGGMRILTSWSDLAEGDRVEVQEVGGSFSTGAVVRHVMQGADRITRVGVEFVENRAPDRLVGTTTSLTRPVFATSRPSTSPVGGGPGPTPPTFRPTPQPSTRVAIPEFRTSASIPRPTTKVSIPPLRTSASIPRPAAPPTPTSSFARPGEGQSSGASVTAGRTEDSLLEEIATIRVAARGLISESKFWEALDSLARAQALAEGTSGEKAIRILTWETQAKIPSLMRAAQQSLEDLARNDPADAAAHSALGRIFWEAGLPARARLAFSRVLALDPSNREATAALAVLNDPTRRR